MQVEAFDLMLPLSSLLVASLLVISGVAYYWAIVFHFIKPTNALSWKMRATAVLGAASMLIHLYCILYESGVAVWRLCVALGFGFVGLLVFLAAIHATHNKRFCVAFSNSTPTYLVTCGIYRWLRHPFYCAYFCTFLMGAVYTMNIVVVISTLLMGAIYLYAASQEERQVMDSPLRSEYQDYRARTTFWRQSASLARRLRVGD